MKRTIYVCCTIALLVGCKKEVKETATTVPTVEIAEVKTVKCVGDLHYSGTIQPEQSIPLTFQTTGNVEQVFVNAGDVVKKGQLLATADKQDAQNMYQMSLAKYQQAKDAYNRLKSVHDQGSLPEIKWVEMESNLQQAESSVAIAKNTLDKCNLRSPADGVIGSRNVEPGMSAMANLKAPLELVKIENVYVQIAVPENEIGKMRKGIKASFKVSALENQVFEGTITNVGVVADQMSRTYEVKILVKNTGLVLKPGMVCDVNLALNAEKEVLAIPYQAVDKDKDNNTFVYVVEKSGKVVHKRIINVGEYQNENIEVLSGLENGEQVVRVGKEKLCDNAQINL